MPTSQHSQRTRLPAITLLTLVVAQFAAPAFGEIEVEVLGVGEDVRANILAYLSFERYKSSDDLSPEFVERLQERSEREVRSAMRPFGYYEPVVKSEVLRRNGSDQDYHVVITVDPGKPVIVDDVEVKVTGPGTADPIFTSITNDLPIQSGDRLSHSSYEALKGGLLRAAATYGYLDARMLRNEMRVDPQAYSADVAIEFETGERYTFGKTVITQDAVDDALARRYLRYNEGDPFNASELLRTQFALDDSQYFSLAEVLPGERDRQARIVPVRITADRNRRHVYTIAAGYGTDTGARGTPSTRAGGGGYGTSVSAVVGCAVQVGWGSRGGPHAIGMPAISDAAARYPGCASTTRARRANASTLPCLGRFCAAA